MNWVAIALFGVFAAFGLWLFVRDEPLPADDADDTCPTCHRPREVCRRNRAEDEAQRIAETP